MNIKEIKIGDKLKCVDDLGTNLIQGKIYTVQDVNDYVYVEELKIWDNGFYSNRFEKPINRDSRGRFNSSKPSVLFNKPETLRNGSLYLVKRKRGTVVARLRTEELVAKEYLVFTRHGKAFLARKKQVGLASKEQVNQYLAEIKKENAKA